MRLGLQDAQFKTLRFRGLQEEANATLGVACQNAASLAAICDLDAIRATVAGVRFGKLRS